MAYGAGPAPSGSGRKTKARAVLRNTILETAVVKGSPGPASGVVPGALAVSLLIHGGAGQGVCFVDNMETVNTTPTRRDTREFPLRSVKPNIPKPKYPRRRACVRACQPARDTFSFMSPFGGRCSTQHALDVDVVRRSFTTVRTAWTACVPISW
jgi:hypothetical protein